MYKDTKIFDMTKSWLGKVGALFVFYNIKKSVPKVYIETFDTPSCYVYGVGAWPMRWEW